MSKLVSELHLDEVDDDQYPHNRNYNVTTLSAVQAGLKPPWMSALVDLDRERGGDAPRTVIETLQVPATMQHRSGKGAKLAVNLPDVIDEHVYLLHESRRVRSGGVTIVRLRS